ncbi:multidrug and toxin extrusion protein 1 isoform X2 [Brienomyrus brachyistius]|uniref:multidrug and toxin extrusion protein 1 isoform X2 n=1 Tax=Brienomyrus brachyistius TaxID=42636 RepID=UPI0020B1DFC4|nr:multidrug and toxin extrusion protein 1 isoform X2 [Brienomyrus brachyistius]
MEKSWAPDVLGPVGDGRRVSGEMGPGGGGGGLLQWRSVCRWIPPPYREELVQLLRLTGPLLASRILYFLLPFVNAIFCGHLGNAELAGFALASATINVTTTATGYGLALACDTLVSQTFGGKNLKRVGEILQRSVLILLLFCLPCWALLINAQSILIALKQETQVARIAQLYVTAFLPAVPAMFLHQLQVAYLQNQGIILPQLYVAVLTNIINVVTNYVLLFWMELGVKGSAVASSLCQIFICLLLFAYIRWKKLYVKTWGGWSTASLQNWGSFMQLAIPSTLMLCFEWWIYEIGGFLAGMLGKVDLAAQHVLLELGAITYMFPLGVHAAACVRVGNALGAGDTASALITSKVSLVFSGVMAVIQGVVLASTKNIIGFIFTSDVNIVELVSHTLYLYIFLQFFDALVGQGEFGDYPMTQRAQGRGTSWMRCQSIIGHMLHIKFRHHSIPRGSPLKHGEKVQTLHTLCELWNSLGCRKAEDRCCRKPHLLLQRWSPHRHCTHVRCRHEGIWYGAPSLRMMK